MKNTKLQVVSNYLNSSQKVKQGIILANDYFRIVIKYKEDYRQAAMNNQVKLSDFRINSLTQNTNVELMAPRIWGNGENLYIETKMKMLEDDTAIDLYAEWFQAAIETREEIFDYFDNEFSEL